MLSQFASLVRERRKAEICRVGKGRTEVAVEQSDMLDADDVAAAIHFACTQPKGSRIIQVQMRTMAESLT
jgi:NADP-dependent 3-hydroxy acid dehydrogenase YdfG